MNTYIILLLLAGGVILSYIFHIIAQKFSIPSVLLLLGTGIALGRFVDTTLVSPSSIAKMVEVLGVIGLMMIILEASLDLTLTQAKAKMVLQALGSALVILLFSSLAIAWIIQFSTGESFRSCLIYATPLSIISSAIVIPSVERIAPDKREFIIYEASFSDIFGILFFNYLVADGELSVGTAFVYSFNMLWALGLTVLVALLLVFLFARIEQHLKYFLLFAVLLLLYAGGKLLHLPSLLIILFFGLLINNRHLIKPSFIVEGIPATTFVEIEKHLKSITAETAFLVRTFFFFLFGYTISIEVFIQKEVWIIGSLVVMALLFIRFVYLKYIQLRTHLLPELLLMPRGLITILLFYSIPSSFQLKVFNEGILFFVILATSLLMMVGVMVADKQQATPNHI